MTIFKTHKVVVNLPSPLEPDTLYLVRVGEGFDLYCTDTTGSIAYKSNNLTASEILESLKTVDGNNSGLDADLLDGLHIGQSGNNYIPYVNSNGFLGINHANPISTISLRNPTSGNSYISWSSSDGTGNLTNIGTLYSGGSPYIAYNLKSSTNSVNWVSSNDATISKGVINISGQGFTFAGSPASSVPINSVFNPPVLFNVDLSGVVKAGSSIMWHEGNDGSGSGLDADLLDGLQSTSFARITTVPATATSAGTTGQIAYDTNFFYVCVDTNTWRRTALSTW